MSGADFRALGSASFWQRVASERQTIANIERARADKAEALLRGLVEAVESGDWYAIDLAVERASEVQS